jgi:hypothetical protein
VSPIFLTVISFSQYFLIIKKREYYLLYCGKNILLNCIANIEVIMRFLNYMALLSLIVSYTALPQGMVKKYPVKENLTGNYPIDGSHLLWKQDQEVAQWVKEHPDYYNKMKLSKTSSWGFSIGSTRDWLAYDFTKSSNYYSSSTCRGIGSHCYVFVENTEWNSKVNQAAVDSVINEFENKTPANSGKGIYQTDVDAFGNPPDIDNDPRIIILILDIKDGYSGTGGYTAGYFSSVNEISTVGSNNAELYYMDCNPTDLTTSSGLQTALETCAHEFQHMINWNYHKSNPEMTFVNEGCSMAAEIICGYSAFFPGLYAGETNDYSRAQRYFIYWLDKFGTGVFQKIVQDSQVGLAGLANALTSDGQSISFTQLFINWLIANKLDDITVNSAYGYATYTGLTKAVSGHTYYDPNIKATDTIANLGAEYISFTSGSNLSITFNASSTSNLVIKAIEEGNGGSRVLDVTPNTAFTESAYGSIYTSIHFAVINTSTSSKQVFSYTATGTAPSNETELKWDITEPTGYYSWTTSDTICVAFDAVAGGKLDSIKVALRRAGSITGGVWNYTGSATQPLGKKLAPVTASITTTTAVPYPVPYDNWSTVDLRPYKISTNNPFAVGFVIGSDPKTPGVMITDYNSQDAYHSYTYMQTSDEVTSPGWYYITSSDTTVAIYLIRAYVSMGSGSTPDTTKTDTTITVKNYSLEQNYPNPFNPYTTISFVIPNTKKVKITVFDQLGRQVAVVTDAEYPSGSHNIKFYGAGLPSGIYFYRIESGGYTQTKKMALVK